MEITAAIFWLWTHRPEWILTGGVNLWGNRSCGRITAKGTNIIIWWESRSTANLSDNCHLSTLCFWEHHTPTEGSAVSTPATGRMWGLLKVISLSLCWRPSNVKQITQPLSEVWDSFPIRQHWPELFCNILQPRR